MVKRLVFLATYVLFWIGFFEIGRLIFLAYQWKLSAAMPPIFFFSIPIHGMKMDVSAAFVATLLPACVISRAGFIPASVSRRLILIYTVFLVGLASLGIAADLEIFSRWGSRLDRTPLQYLKTPAEAFASSRNSPLILLCGLALLLGAATMYVFVKGVLPRHDVSPKPSWLDSLGVLVLAGLFIIPIRGGTQHIPLTQSTGYFSHDHFANQATVNPIWNFVASVIIGDVNTEAYRFTTDTSASKVADSLLATRASDSVDGLQPTPILLKVKRPNILLIVWEGLTAKIVKPAGGIDGITPNLSSLCSDGILFDSVYASGNRTPIGLAAILSGFPSQPMAMTIESPTKSAALPNLGRTLSRQGYTSSFYYGGQLEFANIKRYLIDGGYQQLVGRGEFSRSEWHSEWGVHDQVVFSRVIADLRRAPRPWFTVVLTLSSHEPFDVPMPTVIRGASLDRRFLNSQVYADRSVGEFIAKAKKEPWWDSTLVLITADHGTPYPELVGEPLTAERQYRIPMLWLGGAVALRDTVVGRIMSQTDLAKTLLGQMTLSSSEFKWGRNIFAARPTTDFAYYSFVNGFGYVDRRGSYVFDDVSRSVVFQREQITPEAVNAGRSFQQTMVRDYRQLDSTGRASR